MNKIIRLLIAVILCSCNITYQTRSGEYNWQGEKIDTIRYLRVTDGITLRNVDDYSKPAFLTKFGDSLSHTRIDTSKIKIDTL